jgi:hypothetical protein
MNEKLTRDVIIKALIDKLKPLDFVHAFWEGGAIAFNRVDQWSDIDLYAAVDDDKTEDAFLVVEQALKALSPMKQKLKVPQLPWQGLHQVFYKLENTSEYLLIDFVAVQLSAPDKLLETGMHGKVVFYFNKGNKVKVPKLDKDAFNKKLRERFERLKIRFELFNSFVQKEINRGNYLEAIDFYQTLTLATLVELLRIKYYPLHYNFKMHYVHYELPSEIVKKLLRLYFVKNENDLQKKYCEASKWVQEMFSEIQV